MTDTPAWFPDLDPPPGGERRLHLALQARPAVPGWHLATVAVGCAVLGIALSVSAPWSEQARIDHALRSAWVVPDAPRVEHGQSREVASGDPEVRLYLVTLAPVPARR